MKRIKLMALMAFCCLNSFCQNVGIGTISPNSSAALEISSGNKGLLPPRVTLTGTNDVITIATPASGLLVYNMATAGVVPNNVTPGYYFYTGSGWLRINNQQGNNTGDMLYWNGTQWALIAAGSSGQTLTLCNGVPVWGACPPVPPTITTTAVSAITSTSASSGGNISNTGNATITDKGVCYSTSPNPTILNAKVAGSAQPPATTFTASLTSLNSSTIYYIRAYATNNAGTGYGNEISFTTAAPPNGINYVSLTTTAASAIAQTSATTGLTITNNGGQFPSVKGVCYSTSPGPGLQDSVISVGGNGNVYSIPLTGLTAGTVYYVRAFASNAAGTAFGNEINFATASVAVPTMVTSTATSITNTTASVSGHVSSDGGATVISRGICYSTTLNPTIANNVVNPPGGGGGGSNPTFGCSLAGLTPGTIYYCRAFATNSAGTGYGNQTSFTTTSPIAFTATYPFTDVTTVSGETDPTTPPTVTGLTFSNFTSSNVGTAPFYNSTVSSRFSFTNWPTASTLDNGKYYEFTITPTGGMELTTITFKFQRTSNGVRQACIRSSIDNYATNLPASINPANANLSVVATNIFQIADIAISQDGCTITLGAAFSNLTSAVTFRMYAFGNEQNTGTFNIDDVVITGVSR